MVEIDAPLQFWDQVDRTEKAAKEGDEYAGRVLRWGRAALAELRDRQRAPADADPEQASLKPVRQSGPYRVWRASHPYDPVTAVRLICYFPPGDEGAVVVALFAGDKARIGDVFYNSVGGRADTLIDIWCQQARRDEER